jgi:hypothetical protein
VAFGPCHDRAAGAVRIILRNHAQAPFLLRWNFPKAVGPNDTSTAIKATIMPVVDYRTYCKMLDRDPAGEHDAKMVPAR